MGYEREDGEVSEDEEEVIFTKVGSVQDNIPPTISPDVNDLRLAVFRSVVKRKMAEKALKPEGNRNLPSKKKFKAPLTEINQSSQSCSGSSSDMEVEMWDSARAGSMYAPVSEIISDETSQEDFKPEILQTREPFITDASIIGTTTIAEKLVTLDLSDCPTKSISKCITGGGLIFTTVFHFKEGEQLDSFGLGLREQKHMRHQGNSDTLNTTSAESQKLGAILSYWPLKGSRTELSSIPDGRRDSASIMSVPAVGTCLESHLPASSIERQLVVPLIKRTISTVSMTNTSEAFGATSGSGSVNGTRIRTIGGAGGKKKIESTAFETIPNVTSKLTAAQQRSKIEEDIARLKVEILMREKKAKRLNAPPSLKPPLSTGTDSNTKVWDTLSPIGVISSKSKIAVSTVQVAGKAPRKKYSSSNSPAAAVPGPVPRPAPGSGPGSVRAATECTKLSPAPCLLSKLTTITASSSSSGNGNGNEAEAELQDERLLRAAALTSRKKKQTNIPPNNGSTVDSSASSISFAAFVPVPLSVSLLAPPAPAPRGKTYPSSRCNLAFSGGHNHVLAAPPDTPNDAFLRLESTLISSTDPSISLTSLSRSVEIRGNGRGKERGRGRGRGRQGPDALNDPIGRIYGLAPLLSGSSPSNAAAAIICTARKSKPPSRIVIVDQLEEGEEVEEYMEMREDGQWRVSTPASTISASSNISARVSVGAQTFQSLVTESQQRHQKNSLHLSQSPSDHILDHHVAPTDPDSLETFGGQTSLIRECPMIPSSMDMDMDMDIDVDIDMDVDVDMVMDMDVESINGVLEGAPSSAVHDPSKSTGLPAPAPACSPNHLSDDLIQRVKRLKQKPQQLKLKSKNVAPANHLSLPSSLSLSDTNLTGEEDAEYMDIELEQYTVGIASTATATATAAVTDTSAYTLSDIDPLTDINSNAKDLLTEQVKSKDLEQCASSSRSSNSSSSSSSAGEGAVAGAGDDLLSLIPGEGEGENTPLSLTGPSDLQLSPAKESNSCSISLNNAAASHTGHQCLNSGNHQSDTTMHSEVGTAREVCSSDTGDEDGGATRSDKLMESFIDASGINSNTPHPQIVINDPSNAVQSSYDPIISATIDELTTGGSMDLIADLTSHPHTHPHPQSSSHSHVSVSGSGSASGSGTNSNSNSHKAATQSLDNQTLRLREAGLKVRAVTVTILRYRLCTSTVQCILLLLSLSSSLSPLMTPYPCLALTNML